MDELNITSNPRDALAAIAEVKAALATLEGKTVTVNYTRAQYEARTGRRWDPSESAEERSGYLRAAIRRLGEC
jgi:hypothetical protein